MLGPWWGLPTKYQYQVPGTQGSTGKQVKSGGGFRKKKRTFVHFTIDVYFETERQRGSERIRSSLGTVSAQPQEGRDPTNCEIMTRAEIQSRTLN